METAHDALKPPSSKWPTTWTISACNDVPDLASRPAAAVLSAQVKAGDILYGKQQLAAYGLSSAVGRQLKQVDAGG